ncbi:hypothetical protein ACRAWD_12940 [Caulobacter segnis]
MGRPQPEAGRNQSVIAKECFDLPVTFAAGQDRAYARETLEQITDSWARRAPRSAVAISRCWSAST